MNKIKPCVSCPVISFSQVGETQGEVEGSGWVHPECHLLKRLAFSKESREPEGRPVAQAVAKLGIPGVNQKLHFQIIRQIQFESEKKQQLCKQQAGSALSWTAFLEWLSRRPLTYVNI